MEKLDIKQMEAVTSKSNRVLCDAIAGSGKTKVLMNRVLYLLEKGINPYNILLVTFTNKAAQEMMHRIEKLTPVGDKIMCGTFHNIALRFCRVYAEELGFTDHFTVISPDDSVKIVKKIIDVYKDIGIIDDSFKEKVKPLSIVRDYSSSRNLNISLQEFFETKEYTFGQISIIEKIIDDFTQKKKNLNVMDFDDLLENFSVILQDKKINKEITGRLKYILVDEYQDINDMQYTIIDFLTNDKSELFCVGDKAQCIYRFRGSKVEYIENFHDFYGGDQITLENNYRSTQEILDLASEATDGKIKMFGVKGHGKKPELHVINGGNKSLAAHVVKDIKNLIMAKTDPKEIAILTRSTVFLKDVEFELKKQNIPYVMRAGFSYMERAHVKDVLAFLAFMANKKNVIYLSRILSLFPNLGSKTVEKIVDGFIKNKYNFKDMKIKLSLKQRKTFEEFIDLLKKMYSQYTIKDVIKTLLDEFYLKYMSKKYDYDELKERKQDIKELIKMASEYKSIKDFVNAIMIDSSIDNKKSGNDASEKIVLSTVHRAKGLEWDNVFIINMNNIFDKKGYNPGDVELDSDIPEEVSLLYVAITRARKNLNLYITGEEYNHCVPKRASLSYWVRKLNKLNTVSYN